jgi:hypothetical protein
VNIKCCLKPGQSVLDIDNVKNFYDDDWLGRAQSLKDSRSLNETKTQLRMISNRSDCQQPDKVIL